MTLVSQIIEESLKKITTSSAASVSNPIQSGASSVPAGITYDDTPLTYSTLEEEDEKDKNKQDDKKDSSLPVWLQKDSYKDDHDDGKDSITQEDVSNALNDIVKFELSERGKEDTVFYSDKYNEGFTHNGQIVSGSCTEGGMKKAILGGSTYITVTKAIDEDGDGVADSEVTMSGVEAMADSYDSILDLYTQSQFQKVLSEYGWGTFGDGCNFMKHVDEIREKYGIDIKEVPTDGPDGVSHRTYEISMVDENGNIIEDADGNKSTILFGDWVIPDGCAQGAEADFIAIIDQSGFDCISKADFIDNEAFANNPEFQDENGNYDAGKAYAYVLNQIENDFNNMQNGQGQFMKSGNQTINQATYTTSTFTWWSAGGDAQYYGNSGIDPSLLGDGGNFAELYDLDKDGTLSQEEWEKMLQDRKNKEDEEGTEEAKDKNTKNTNVQTQNTQQQGQAQVEQVRITNKNIYELEDLIAQAQAKNPNVDIEDIIEEYAKDNNLDERALTKKL